MTDLLDANALIALCVVDHPHHAPALRWVDRCDRFAVCPMTEGALLRYVFRVAPERQGAGMARDALRLLGAHPKHVFWPDALTHARTPLDRVQGHKQVTDAYLVVLAAHHGGRLATFDRGLAAIHPEAVLVDEGTLPMA